MAENIHSINCTKQDIYKCSFFNGNLPKIQVCEIGCSPNIRQLQSLKLKEQNRFVTVKIIIFIVMLTEFSDNVLRFIVTTLIHHLNTVLVPIYTIAM